VVPAPPSPNRVEHAEHSSSANDREFQPTFAGKLEERETDEYREEALAWDGGIDSTRPSATSRPPARFLAMRTARRSDQCLSDRIGRGPALK
jgi:hypothetical protein